MRHLFVPACLCLMTFASATAPEPNLPTGPTENAAATSRADDKVHTTETIEIAARGDAPLAASAEPVVVDIPPPRFPILLPLLARLPPVVKPVVPRSHAEICESLTQAALSNDLPAAFFIRLLFQESRFKGEVVSIAGAQGIAQFMPETSASVGLDNPFDPLQAIPASARLLRDLFQQFGNLGLAAAAYNAGPKRIQDWLAKKGSLPEETQGYVKTITGRAAETWTVAQTGSPAVKVPRHAPCQEAAGLLAWNGPDQIPLPPTRTPAEPATPVLTASASKGKAMLAARAKAKTESKTAAKDEKKDEQKAEKKTAVASAPPAAAKVADKGDKSAKSGKADKPDKAVKGKADAVQLAASKQKKKPLRLTQR